jgi:hypothetical protein
MLRHCENHLSYSILFLFLVLGLSPPVAKFVSFQSSLASISNEKLAAAEAEATPPVTLPPREDVPQGPVSGHWRWGEDARGLATEGGGGSPPCKTYGYHLDCCVNHQNCVDFDGAYMNNDGSALLGVSELSPLLGPGKKMLVFGDSLSFYLGLSLACLADLKEVDSGFPVGRGFQLPSGGVVHLLNAQRCDLASAAYGPLEAFFGSYDVVVLNWAAWYAQESEEAYSACLAYAMGLLKGMSASPGGGKVGIFVDHWPAHFTTPDGHYLEELKTKGGGGLSAHASVEALKSAGFGAWARERGPTRFVGACVPTAGHVVTGWNAKIRAAGAEWGVPIAHVSRVLKGLYRYHLEKYGALDCQHSCFARDLFLPVWDVIVRALLGAVALRNSSTTTGNSSLPPLLPSPPLPPHPVLPLHLDFDTLCPSRELWVDASGMAQTMAWGSTTLPHPSSLSLEFDATSLPALQSALLKAAAAAAGAAASAAGISPTSSTPPLDSSPGRVYFKVQPCFSPPRAITILWFLDVHYGDLALLRDMSANASRGGGMRSGFEEVFLGQTFIASSSSGGCGETHSWDFPVQRHAAWLAAGVAEKGDTASLRAVVCEAALTPARGGGAPMCAVNGALGCTSFPIA